MFSRRADESRWRSLIGGRSIAAHIARLYTLSAVALLAIVVGILFWVESRSLEWDDVHDLSDKVHQLRLVLGKDADSSSYLVHKVKDEGGVFAAGQHYIFYSRILDEAGRILIETPGTEKILPPAQFPRPVDIKEIPQGAERRTGKDGRSYLVISAWGDTGGARPARRMIQVALDDTDEVQFVSAYQGLSVLLVVLGILASAGIGVLIARSGMRPLARMARVAEEITASRLDKRIDPERWPRELTALAKAFDGMLDRLRDSHSRLSRFASD
ncbi:MAG: HAMP domain-containing protein, partial [Betaproteobacteria bacterium]|nr:HAMP domain-containing protein [Betaproteobacteria bacterium]